MYLSKPGPVINTTEKKITFENGVINLPEDNRKKIRKLMNFEKVPTQEILVQRANNIVSCILDGLKALYKEEEIIEDPMDYAWAVVIADCPDFFQRRLEDVMMISILEPVYIFQGGELIWLYDDEKEWSHRRCFLMPKDSHLKDFLNGKIKEEEIPLYPTL